MRVVNFILRILLLVRFSLNHMFSYVCKHVSATYLKFFFLLNNFGYFIIYFLDSECSLKRCWFFNNVFFEFVHFFGLDSLCEKMKEYQKM